MKNDAQQRFYQHLIPHSIQQRLPFSYAAIALLVALSLGGVLVGILSEYYRQQEIDYLNRNATAIHASLARMLEADTPEYDLQAQVNLLAFLSRTQIELLNPDDSLLVASESVMTVVDSDEQQPGVRLMVRRLQENDMWVGLQSEARPAIQTRDIISEDKNILIETIETEAVNAPTIAFGIQTESAPVQSVTHALFAEEDQIFVSYESSLYGSGLTQHGDEITTPARSAQVMTAPITDDNGELVGTLRLSDGPAYGVEIVTSVAWGWLFASLFSITLAIIVGYFISRDVSQPLKILTETTKQMAGGDLTVRTQLHRQDELGTLAKAFNDMAFQIESTVSTLHHFVSDAAHEINTPITALRTNLELIQPQQVTTHDQITLNRAIDQVIRLEDLTRNLLQLSRLESGVNDDDLQPVNMTALIRETVGFYASRADQSNIELELSFPHQNITYHAQENHLRIALSNVLDNAIKFTPGGGRVAITLEQSNQEIAIHIRDTGVGIPPDHLPYVTHRFHRASNVSGYAGSGLGLSIVHTIIARYNGYLSIKNLECGTRVSIYLPCV